MKKPWTQEEMKVLKKFYPLYGEKVTKFDLMQLFPKRSWTSIQHCAERNGIYVNTPTEINRDYLKKLSQAVRSI